MNLFDTHCHIHEILGSDELAAKWHKADVTDADEVLRAARAAGARRLMLVGCTLEDSALAVDFASERDGCWASIGIHPHEAQHYVDDEQKRADFAKLATHHSVRAVGECGLDYYYEHSPRSTQATLLRFQLELAARHDLPLIFHVRDAFEDFWPIFDAYAGLRGVVHSFTATTRELDQALERGLYIGLNGIMTFTKDAAQLEAARLVPPNRLVLETDAPFLTPTPFRGKINKPEYVAETARFLARLRDESPEELAEAVTANACRLFAVE